MSDSADHPFPHGRLLRSPGPAPPPLPAVRGRGAQPSGGSAKELGCRYPAASAGLRRQRGPAWRAAVVSAAIVKLVLPKSQVRGPASRVGATPRASIDCEREEWVDA